MDDDKNMQDVKQGEEDNAPSDSSAGNEENSEDTKVSGEDSEVVNEWSKLKGNTQDRIRELVREKNEYMKKAEPSDRIPTPPASPSDVSEDAKKAAEVLRTKMGFITQEDFDKGMQRLSDQMVLSQTHDRLEGKFSGSDGLPRYDRDVVEDHIRKTGILNPEAAYNDLYKDELLDYHIKQAIKSGKAPYSEGPARPVRKGAPEGLSREDIAKMTPTEYEQNREKILKLIAAGEL